MIVDSEGMPGMCGGRYAVKSFDKQTADLYN